MMKTSSFLADKLKAGALIMGDSLGQVSSQTMQNMSVLDRSIEKLILRPLVGMNKMEILEKSRLITTHDISVIPHDDACSLFSPKHPVTRADTRYFTDFIQKFPCDDLVEFSLNNAEKYYFNLQGAYLKS